MKTSKISHASLLTALIAVALTGCAVITPTGPTVVALPPDGKPINIFQREDYACRDFAFRLNNNPNERGATSQAVGSTAIATFGGAAAGALLGVAAGNAGVGAAIGAGAGLLFGSAVGAHDTQISSTALQARYDAAYAQCMASKGNEISPPAVYATIPAYAPPPVVYAPGPVVYGSPHTFGYWAR